MTAKVFRHGNSQAARLPKEFRIESDKVIVRRSAGGLLLLPKKISYEKVIAAVRQFKGSFERRQPQDQTRKWR